MKIGRNGKTKQNNQALSYILLGAMSLCSLVVISLLAIDRERHLARYPGATATHSYTTYGLSTQEVRWTYLYNSRDPFETVHDWYEGRFNLKRISRINVNCVLLRGSIERFGLERYTSVTLCERGRGQRIFVTRSVSVK